MIARSNPPNAQRSGRRDYSCRGKGRMGTAQWGCEQAVIGNAGTMTVETYIAGLARLTEGQAHV